jgi:Tol biopolymer transport system component
MKTTTRVVVVFLTVLSASAGAQVRVTAVERLALSAETDWAYPRFAPDGSKLFVTSSNHDGIWEYPLVTRKLRQITADQNAGYGIALSADGSQIAYRRTAADARKGQRRQEVVVMDLRTGSARVVLAGKDVSVPAFSRRGAPYAMVQQSLKGTASLGLSDIAILGIENTRIVMQKGGKKVLLDPLGHGSYIWPSLSPDGTRIVACDIMHGAFVCDLDGNVLVRLGKRDAPAWTRDGRWIVYMDDRDDGRRVVSSDLYAVSADGKTTIRLTDTEDLLEMEPQCSPTEDKIACSTLNGPVLLISYKEDAR